MERPNVDFVVTRQHRWYTCEDEDGPKGLAIKVRKDITNRERDDLNDYYREHVSQYQSDWLKMTPEERVEVDLRDDTPRAREWRMLAPYILDWNAKAEDDDGEIRELPAPADAGPEVFNLITKDAIDWLMAMVLYGYRASGKVGNPADG
jgi:hypothetical protein